MATKLSVKFKYSLDPAVEFPEFKEATLDIPFSTKLIEAITRTYPQGTIIANSNLTDEKGKLALNILGECGINETAFPIYRPGNSGEDYDFALNVFKGFFKNAYVLNPDGSDVEVPGDATLLFDQPDGSTLVGRNFAWTNSYVEGGAIYPGGLVLNGYKLTDISHPEYISGYTVEWDSSPFMYILHAPWTSSHSYIIDFPVFTDDMIEMSDGGYVIKSASEIIGKSFIVIRFMVHPGDGTTPKIFMRWSLETIEHYRGPAWFLGNPNLNFQEYEYIPGEYPSQGESISESEKGAEDKGTHDWTSDEIDDVQVSTKSAIATAMVECYVVTQSVLQSIKAQVFNNADYLDSLQHTGQKAMDCIVSIHLLPFTPSHIFAGQQIYLNTIAIPVSADRVVQQYEVFNCGTIDLREFYGNFLDYAPNTDVRIMLPFVGEQQLDVNAVMGRTIRVRYIWDILIGDCICIVYADEVPIYTFAGGCSAEVPITSLDFSESASARLATRQAIRGVALNAGQAVAAQGMGGGASGVGALFGEFAGIGQEIDAIKMTSTPPNTLMAGSLSSAISLNGIRTPYLKISSPRQAYASNQNQLIGGALRRSGKVGEFSGYLECDIIHTDGIPCTDQERALIEKYARGGIIV